jgi:hypothetical protein
MALVVRETVRIGAIVDEAAADADVADVTVGAAAGAWVCADASAAIDMTMMARDSFFTRVLDPGGD